jgi:hypothetical protein
MRRESESMQSDTKLLHDLHAKEQIREVILTAARAVDRGDKVLLKSCFHSDALEEHASLFSGKAHDYIDHVSEPGPITVGAMHHMIGNILITRDEGVAWSESYTVVFARMIKEGVAYDTFTGGRYCDRLELRDGSWRIAHRKIIYDWNRDVPSSESWLLGMYDTSDPKMHLGRMDQDDISYQRF